MAEDRSVPKTDRQRIQVILDEIGSKTRSRRTEPFRIDDSASKLLMNYMEETVASILKESSNLAKHRKSNIVEIEDLQLILTKKYGIEVPGFTRSTLLHKQSIASNLNASSSRSILVKDTKGSNGTKVDSGEGADSTVSRKRGRD